MENQDLPFGEAFKISWDEWLEYRKERKLPKYVSAGLKKTFTMLKRISNNDERTAIGIINQSIENNYQGLFPLKNVSNGNSSSKKSGLGSKSGGFGIISGALKGTG
ncbi:MAG: hypothetical protein QM791_04260 [Ferruginibacter sp.]